MHHQHCDSASASCSNNSAGALSSGCFMHDDVDISRNYGHNTVPVANRESHTADLNEFDRYVSIMSSMDRMESDIPFGGDDEDDEDESPSSPSANNEAASSQEQEDVPHTINMQNMGLEEKNNVEELVPLNDINNCNNTSNLEGGNTKKGDRGNKQSPRYPFNPKFWAYIRGILANAKPVGFDELADPNEVSLKGPLDANNFLSKVIAIGPLNPIQPSIIAELSGFDEDEVLAELFHGTLVGLVTMRFAPECIQCGSAVMDTDMLGNVPSKALCQGCNKPNVIESMDKIKVMFLLNSDVLYVLAENYACTPSKESMSHTSVFAAVPANSTGSGYSYCVGTGEESEIAPALGPGKYRMHCPVAKTDNYLVVKRKTSETDEAVQLNIKVSDLVHNPHNGKRKVLQASHGKIKFDIFPDTQSFFVLWVQKDVDDRTLVYLPEEERTGYTSASKVIHHPIFNSLFQERQVVSVQKNIFLSISNVVLVFTDIVDSTKLYASLGDGDAFRLVRKHFQVLFGAFTRNNGRVVKTIGDAVMASFTTGRAALTAVSEAMQLLPTIGRRPDNDNHIEIRVGIHSGQATVVPLNGVNDYFGQNVNIAARVQSVAKASECFVTETVLEIGDARKAYTEITTGSSFKATPLVQLKLKGVVGEVHARGFRWLFRSRRDSSLSRDASLTSYMNRRGKTPLRTSINSPDSIEDGEEDSDNKLKMKKFERPGEMGRRKSNLDVNEEELTDDSDE